MTPAARIAAAAAVLDRIIAGGAAEHALLTWARGSRFAGSGDRAAVRDLVFDSLRRRRSRAALGGDDSGRGLMLGLCREQRVDPDTIFGAGPHALAPLTEEERRAGRMPDADEASDLPDWLLPSLRADLGEDFGAIAEAMRHRAPVWLRTNLLRATPDEAIEGLAREGIAAIQDTALPQALRVTEGARRVGRSGPYLSGMVELQDLSAQMAVALLGDLHGLTVLDCCAGGGGKTLALAAAGAAGLVAHDADAARMRDLPDRAARAGATVTLSSGDMQARGFDLVVADVPCSGSGSWRRDPAGRWTLTPERLGDLCATQADILDRAARLTRPGGRLAYMTCSLLDQENDAQIAAFLHRTRGARQLDQRTMTPLNASDGFFVSVLGIGGC